MWETVVIQIVTYVITAILGVGFGVMRARVQKLSDEREQDDKRAKALEDGMKLIMKRELFDAHKAYCANNEPMTLADRQYISEVHDVYKALNGNGTGDAVFEDLLEVELVD